MAFSSARGTKPLPATGRQIWPTTGKSREEIWQGSLDTSPVRLRACFAGLLRQDVPLPFTIWKIGAVPSWLGQMQIVAFPAKAANVFRARWIRCHEVVHDRAVPAMIHPASPFVSVCGG